MENKEKVGFFDNLGATIRGELERRKNDKGELLFDIVIFTVSFLFSRCHIVFGAYPLAISLIAVLNKGVWIALIGGVAGSLTLGSLGIIQSIIAVVVVFLRVIISGGGRQGEPSLFEEPLILKIASAAIGAFIGAAYEILLGNFSLKSIIYGASAVVLSSLFTFAFAGILDYKISFSEFLFGRKNILIKPKDEKERMAKYLFEATFLLFIFLVSISLREYVAFGISLSYIFCCAILSSINHEISIFLLLFNSPQD